MAVIDPRKNWALVEQRLATETDPILKRNLTLVYNHMKAEASLDFERLMSTVAEDARYHFFGSEDDEAFAGPKGKTNVEAFYQSIIVGKKSSLRLVISKLMFGITLDQSQYIHLNGVVIQYMEYDIIQLNLH